MKLGLSHFHLRRVRPTSAGPLTAPAASVTRFGTPVGFAQELEDALLLLALTTNERMASLRDRSSWQHASGLEGIGFLLER
jgi:hypothetical protein